MEDERATISPKALARIGGVLYLIIIVLVLVLVLGFGEAFALCA